MGKSEIVIYKSEDGNIKVDVLFEDETVWLTIDQMSTLFGKSRSTINEHILNVYAEGELSETDTIRKIGNSDFSTKPTNFYNLDVIISFTLNDERFTTGSSMNYFKELLERIREIRLSEKVFYQQVKDIYATSIDYDPSDEMTLAFYKEVQNKLLWAVSGKTAAELVYYRANATLPMMGLTSTSKPGKVTKVDALTGKNYLSEEEIKVLKLIVEQYLAYAESQATQHKPMYMKDWIEKLRLILTMNEKTILECAGSISHELAVKKGTEEYVKYKDAQKKLEHLNSIKELDNDIKKLTSKKKKK